VRDEFEFCTPKTKTGILHIRSLGDAAILAAARDNKSAEHGQILAWMNALPPDPTTPPGFNTNPHWVTGQCAEEAYKRDLIDERELDWITR
jgi:hypothetical protein